MLSGGLEKSIASDGSGGCCSGAAPTQEAAATPVGSSLTVPPAGAADSRMRRLLAGDRRVRQRLGERRLRRGRRPGPAEPDRDRGRGLAGLRGKLRDPARGEAEGRPQMSTAAITLPRASWTGAATAFRPISNSPSAVA